MAARSKRFVLPVPPAPGPASHRSGLLAKPAAGAVRAGANLAPERAVGHRTWEDFLAER